MEAIINLMLAIREYSIVFYHKDTNCFDYYPCSSIELEKRSPNERIRLHDTNNFRLPLYNEINHKEIFSFFVRECVENKTMRKQLFSTLRRKDFIDDFIDKIHELNLYNDFVDICGDIYLQIFETWQNKNNLNIIFQKKEGMA